VALHFSITVQASSWRVQENLLL